MATYNIDFQSNNAEGIPGKAPISLPKNTIDTTSTSLSLTGQGVSLYGELQQENFIRLLENFASATPPAHPTVGQFWFDKANNVAKIYDRTQTWIEVSGGLHFTTTSTPPANTTEGQFWWNSAEQFLYLKVDPNGIWKTAMPRYFDGTWVQVFPDVVVVANQVEYNAAAARINKVVGAPLVDGTGKWGWGETDLLPIYTDKNTPTQFDNTAWVTLISRLLKATRHLDQALAPESAIDVHGFILDDRGTNATATSYSPTTSLQNGWGGVGIVTVMNRYNNFLSALTALETNRFSINTLDTTLAAINTSTRPSWTQTKVLDLAIHFGTLTAAERFFNAGGQLRFNISLSGQTTALAGSWNDLLTNAGTNVNDFATAGFVLDYNGTKFGPANGTYAGLVGFYGLTSTYQTLVNQVRGGAYGSGSLQIEAKIDTTSAYDVLVRITFTEDLDAGVRVDGTTTVVTQVRKSTGSVAGGPTVSTPVIATPSATASNTFLTVPAE